MHNLIMLILMIIIASCTTPLLEMDPEKSYQKDLSMRVRTWTGSRWSQYNYISGMGVVPLAKGYKIRIDPPGKADMITVLSCHRESKTPNPKLKGGWFKDKYYEFEIWPTKEHEINNSCSFDAGVYEKRKGRHAWGLLVVQDERATLPTLLKCNGETKAFEGTSVCQAKKGLIQSFHFEKPVLVTQVKGCHVPQPRDNKNFVFQMPGGECTIFFVETKNSESIHKSVLFGYDVIPIRGVE